MTRPCVALAVVLSFASAAAFAVQPSPPPPAPVHPVVDNDWGRKVVDPYRWMESEPKPQFDQFLHTQNDYARAVLARIPGRDALRHDIETVSGLAGSARMVTLAGGRAFFLRRDPNAQIAKLFVRAPDGRETLLVDPTTYNQGARHAEIDQFQPSFDGTHVVYGISVGGSENSTLHVIDTTTGQNLPDSIDRCQFASASWAPDGRSFFFSRLPASSLTAKMVDRYSHLVVFRHVLGTDPSSDTRVLDSDHLPFAFHAAQIYPTITTTEGSPFAIADISDGVSNESAIISTPIADLLAGHPRWTHIADQSDDIVGGAVEGTVIDLLSHKEAPRFKIIELDLDHPELAQARTIVPEGAGVITAVARASDGLYWAERDGSAFSLHRRPSATDAARLGAAEAIALPFAGTILPPEEGSGGLVTDPTRPGALVSLESWVHPDIWFRYDPTSGHVADSGILPSFPRDLSGYTAVETTATARDGTRIPISIVFRKGLARDGRRPTYLVGYGSYGISYDPFFSPDFLPWLDRGGVFAVAHVRGGGELGDAWHAAGKIDTKQNTIHDFIDCAEYLIKQGYTDTAHLGGEGTSAGGILIGGAITQRPDLFRAALIRVGATNTTREEFTANGPSNIPEFGTVTNKAQFPAMLAMDAYQHVHKGVAYPAVLLTGGANDPRVSVWIPAKMTARLQADTTSDRPVLFRVEFDAGHGIGSTRKQRDDETADEFAFLLWQFGESGFQPGR